MLCQAEVPPFNRRTKIGFQVEVCLYIFLFATPQLAAVHWNGLPEVVFTALLRTASKTDATTGLVTNAQSDNYKRQTSVVKNFKSTD